MTPRRRKTIVAAMPRKRSQATPAKTGRTWSPLSGLTITERGPKQFQARVRRTGRAAQTKTFDTSAEAEAWGVNILDGFNRNTFVDRRQETRTTLSDVLEKYKETGVRGLKSAVQARSQIDQLLKTDLAPRFVGEIGSADVIAWLRTRRAGAVRRKKRDHDGRVVKVKSGRKLVVQYEDFPIGEKTVLNELMRLSAAFVFARVEMGLQGLRNPVDDIPAKDKPKRRERNRRLRRGEEERLLDACRESRCKPLAAVVELAWETACRRGEILDLLRWEDIDLDARTAKLRGTKSSDGSYRERTIGLSSRAMAILQELPRTASGRVFSSRADSISRNFRAACERAGIKDLTFHDQRSEGASRMAGDRGLDIVELAEQGGWRSLQVLKKYYRPDPKKIAAKLDGRA
jgi:integrase